MGKKINTIKFCPTCKRVYTIHLQHGQLIKSKVNYLKDFPTYGKERVECINCQEKELKEYVEKNTEKQMNKDKVQGVFIHHSFFEIEDLSLPQKLIYAKICDLDNEKGCYASNKYFAQLFKISTRQVSTHINNLVDKGYVKSKMVYKEDSNEIDYRVLNTTSRGIDAEQHKGYRRTLPISKDNTNNNIKEREKQFIKEVKSFKGYEDIADAFISHWTEANKSNTKMRFESEKFFDKKRRLDTWIRNDAKWNRKSKQTTEFKLDSTGRFHIAYCDACNTSDFYDKFEVKQDSRCCNATLIPEKKELRKHG